MVYTKTGTSWKDILREAENWSVDTRKANRTDKYRLVPVQRGKSEMAVFLIDYENIVSQNGMKGIQNLCRQDKLIMFYSDSCPNIRKDEMEIIINSKCDFEVYKLVKTGKNALDFYIAVETGALIEQGERQIAIVSNDKGFMAVLDYVQLKYQEEKICVCKAPSIERAITALNNPEDIDRRKRISEGMNSIGIVSSYRRFREKKALEDNVLSTFGSTLEEEKIQEIIRLLSDYRTKSLKEIYNGFLHTFGRVNGTEIYRIAKSLLPGSKCLLFICILYCAIYIFLYIC